MMTKATQIVFQNTTKAPLSGGHNLEDKKMENRYDYYYGQEAEQFRYYQIPKELLDNPEFSSLSLDSKLLYAVLRDRMQLSRANSWVDKSQRIYIIFSIESISQTLRICAEKAIRHLKELENFGLVEKKRRGQGRDSLLYVKNFASNNHSDKGDPEKETNNQEKYDSTPLSSTELTASCQISDISRAAKTEFKKSENPNSRNRQNRTLEFGEAEPNDLKENNTKRSEPNESIHSFNLSTDYAGPTDRVNERRPIITLGLNERLSSEDQRYLENTIDKYDGIPWTMVNNPDLMKKMMMYIGCWKEMYLDERDHDSVTIHRVAIECLAEMALEQSPWSCKGSMITYKPVIERINCTLQEAKGQLLYELIDRVVDKYRDASLENYIQNPKQYLKAIIWEELYAAKLEIDSYYRKRIHDDFGYA